ncbi:hypothetical protein GDO86_001820 [Hymenochirus boettgeri]|uniref:Uncharacterized protein n=1 Tax=Hymenochirus boettgeri TaxID=247094 RepID=A0A8T2KMK5_9PIPI|nr:hypothetical protein GDO86_001820 [Hymenochirus boettgeri]
MIQHSPAELLPPAIRAPSAKSGPPLQLPLIPGEASQFYVKISSRPPASFLQEKVNSREDLTLLSPRPSVCLRGRFRGFNLWILIEGN